MSIITKPIIILLYISIIATVYCKPKELSYRHTVIPNKMFGIDFCKVQVVGIIKKLQEKNSLFKCYYYDFKNDLLNEIKYIGKKSELLKISFIVANAFIGTLDGSKIVNSTYEYELDDGDFNISIKFKEDYYSTLLELLKKKLGSEKANINFNKYDEISWSANPDMSVPTCITDITLSKRLRYDTPEKAEKGVCYLVINTRARNPHVH